MAKLKLPFELEKPSNNEFVTQADQIGVCAIPLTHCINLQFLSNSEIRNYDLNYFFKELYITGLDSNTDYCLRTLRNTGTNYQINIGTSSGSVVEINVEIGSSYGHNKQDDIECYVVLQNQNYIVGNMIFGNADTTICSLDKSICADLDAMPCIKDAISSNNFNESLAETNAKITSYDVIKEMYIVGGSSTYRFSVKKKTDNNLYCNIEDENGDTKAAATVSLSNAKEVITISQYKSSGVRGYIVVNVDAIPLDDDHYYTYIYRGDYRSLRNNPSIYSYLETEPNLSALDNNLNAISVRYFTNAIRNNVNLSLFFKELYIKGLDNNTDYCLRTLRKAGNGIQINIGNSSASVLEIHVIFTDNVAYGYSKNGNIEGYVVLRNMDSIVGNMIFANSDTSICALDKSIVSDITNSPFIKTLIIDKEMEDISVNIEHAPHFNGYAIPKNPSILKILSIGNSFVDQPLRRLVYWLDSLGITQVVYGKVSRAGGSLQQHLDGLNTTYDAYFSISEPNSTTQDDFVYVNPATGVHEKVQIKLSDALKYTDWDIITFQQNSANSGKWETISPYLPQLIQAARYYCPNAGVKIGWQQTWAYATGYSGLSSYGNSQDAMFEGIIDCSKKVCSKFGLDLIIPNGVVMQHLRSIPNSFWGEDVLSIKGYDSYSAEHPGADFCEDGSHPNDFAEYCLCGTFVQMLINCAFNKTINGHGSNSEMFKNDYKSVGIQSVLKAIGKRFSLSSIDTE